MTNQSRDGYVSGLYCAMLKDIAERHPELRADSERDCKRLLSLIKTRGSPYYLVDLPSFGKHLDQCLAKGHLTKSGIAGFRSYRSRGPVPRLFKGLFLRVFDDFGQLLSDPDVTSIGYLRQLCAVAKKLLIECPDPSTWEQVDEFFKIDREVRSPTLDWDGDDLGPYDTNDLHFGDHVSSGPDDSSLFKLDDSPTSLDVDYYATVQSVADAVTAEIGGFDPIEWKFRHGPGAVSDLRKDKFKYLFPNWPEKLEKVFPMADFAFASFDHWVDFLSQDGLHGSFLNHEPPSRLIAVPKTFSGPRLIASEPVAHQWCQQSIRDFLVRRVEATSLGNCISFRDQRPNQDFALRASDTQSHSTIDLSSASDRISCWVIERLFRRSPTLLSALHAVRTRWITQDIDMKSPSHHRLRKFTTMGSAVTFPVQTILFAIISISAILYREKLKVSYDNIRHASRRVRVFGDDIIVPLHVHDDVVALLTDLQLKVNPSKTFATGRFRESCGVDAYAGHDVTKVSIRHVPSVSSPASVLSAVDTHNLFYKKKWHYVCQYIKKAVDDLRRYRFRLVGSDSGAIGWACDFHEYDDSYQSRWNHDLHRHEVRVTMPCGTVSRSPVDSSTMLLQYFTEVHEPPKRSEERLGVTALRSPLRLRDAWVPV
ncbi:MAG: putative replicase protein [Alehxovirus allofundivicinum]|uniref:RNA-directed RNA polymerase n=1 Tax=Leviviridae sp. TaxID=2027243 RepID=A0ABY3SSF6_9VIRU|nr:MAG: putative replicase protein [Leviviridae sp.]